MHDFDCEDCFLSKDYPSRIKVDNVIYGSISGAISAYDAQGDERFLADLTHAKFSYPQLSAMLCEREGPMVSADDGGAYGKMLEAERETCRVRDGWVGPRFIVAFTGHRPKDLYGYADTARYSELASAIADYVRGVAAANGGVDVITGGAQGVDQVAFWAAERCKQEGANVRTRVYLPYEDMAGRHRWREDGNFGRRQYDQMVARADEVRTCNHVGSGKSFGQQLNWRNEAMVNDARLGIAVTDLSPADLPARGSGTANCMRSMARKGIGVTVISPTTFDVREYGSREFASMVLGKGMSYSAQRQRGPQFA